MSGIDLALIILGGLTAAILAGHAIDKWAEVRIFQARYKDGWRTPRALDEPPPEPEKTRF